MLKHLFAILLLPLVALAAPTPLVNIDPQSGSVNDLFQLSVSVSGQSGGRITPPTFSDSSDFSIESTGTSTSRESINGDEVFQVSFTFQVTPRSDLSPGVYELPEGSMRIDGEVVALNTPKIRITPAEKQAAQGEQYPGMAFVQVVDNDHPYVGQQILYRAELATSESFNRATIEDLKLNGMTRETLNQGKERIRAVGNTTVHSIMEVLFPLRAGKIVIPPRSLVTDVVVKRPPRARRGRNPWGMFSNVFPDLDDLQDYTTVPRKIVAPELALNVRELPSPPVGVSGYLPVGIVRMRSTVDQTKIKQGESVTMTIEINGDANLRPYELPAPVGPDIQHFKVYVDKPTLDVTTAVDRVQFRKTFKIALVAVRSGSLKVPVYTITSFNPNTEQYERASTPEVTLQVIPDPAAAKLVSAGAIEQPKTLSPKTDVQVLGEDILPQHVGPETYARRAVLPQNFLLLNLLFPPLAALLFAVYASKRRAHRFDPFRERQRSALKRSTQALRDLGGTKSADWGSKCLRYLQDYLGDRFRVTGESLTSVDAARLVKEKTADEKLARDTETLFAKLQRIVYGAGAASSDELVSEAIKLLEAIDRNAR